MWPGLLASLNQSDACYEIIVGLIFIIFRLDSYFGKFVLIQVMCI